MSHSVAGEPPSAGRRAAPSTTAAYSTVEWDLLTGLPGQVVVAATTRPGRDRQSVQESVAGLEAVAAGRAFDSDLVRAVAAAIYARHDDESPVPAGCGRGDLAQLLSTCRIAVGVLARRADPADSAAYRQWVQSVAARVCQVVPTDRQPDVVTVDRLAGVGGVQPADRRFLALLGGALGLR